jgi:hypothetical protein
MDPRKNRPGAPITEEIKKWCLGRRRRVVSEYSAISMDLNGDACVKHSLAHLEAVTTLHRWLVTDTGPLKLWHAHFARQKYNAAGAEIEEGDYAATRNAVDE